MIRWIKRTRLYFAFWRAFIYVPIAGGADDDGEGAKPEGGDGEGGSGGEPQKPEGQPQDKPLGEAGEKALEAFKTRAREAEKRAKELETRITEFEEKDKSELEKAQGQVSKLEQAKADADKAAQNARVEAAVLRAAAEAGIQKPAAASKLMDWTKIEYDDQGQPTNVPNLLEDLGKEYPELLTGQPRPRGLDGGTRQTAEGGDTESDFDSMIRERAR